MELFLTSLAVVLPLALKLALGYSIRRFGLLSKDAFREVNALIFSIFLPALLFKNIYSSNLSRDFVIDLILMACGGLIAIFTLAMLIIPRIEKENAKRGVLVQAISRSNFIIFGSAVVHNLYGDSADSLTSIVVSIAVPLINILSVIALESFRNATFSLFKTLRGILINPIIMAALGAYLIKITGIILPEFAFSFIAEVASIATPLAIIVLGGSVSYSHVERNKIQLVIGTAGKLLIAPLLGISAAVLLGFRHESLVIIMSLFASPTAVSSFPMAIRMNGDGELAGLIVVFTTFLSIFTLFIITFLLLMLGFI